MRTMAHGLRSGPPLNGPFRRVLRPRTDQAAPGSDLRAARTGVTWQRGVGRLPLEMAEDRIIAPVQLQPTQMEIDQQLLRDEDLLNEEHLRRMDQVLLRRNLDHARMFSRKLSLELQQFVHLYTPEANELRRRIEKYMVMEKMIEREMARRHTY